MILCAALKIEGKTGDIIIPCVRHALGWQILRDLNFPDISHVEEGFVDTSNHFYNRERALEEAKECGQLSASVREMIRREGTKELYSEYLY